MLYRKSFNPLLVSLVVQLVKKPPVMQEETWVRSLGWEGHWRREWQPTPVFLPGEFIDWRAWRATVHEVAKSWTRQSDYHFHFQYP